MKKILISILLLSMWTGCGHQDGGGSGTIDPLPSWSDGPLRESIIAFVREVTDSSNRGFVPVADRIATFDNDGTLWAEKPYVQEVFAITRAKQMIQADPHLAKVQPFKAIAENDKTYFAKGGDRALLQLVALTHTGMTEDQFEKNVVDFYAQAVVNGRAVKYLVYQPQLELLDYLRANGFKIFICTGGTIEVVRGISESLYGVPKEQVIGTSFRYRFVDSIDALMREADLDHFNDKEGKPVGIQLHIGRRPVFACGNVGGDGDIAMLKFCQGNHFPSFQMLINHDDSVREFAYSEADNGSLHAAVEGHWHVVSMKNDWKKIFR